MFFISVSLVLSLWPQHGPPLLPKASPRGATRDPCPGRGSRRCGQQAEAAHSQPLLAALQGPLGLAPAARSRGPGKAPTALGPDSLLSPLPARPCSSGGGRWPRATRHPGLVSQAHATQHHVRKLTRLGVRSREPGLEEGAAHPARQGLPAPQQALQRAPRGPASWRSLQEVRPKAKRPGPGPGRKGTPEQA